MNNEIEILDSEQKLIAEVRALLQEINKRTEALVRQRVEVKFNTDCKRNESSGEYQWVLSATAHRKSWL